MPNYHYKVGTKEGKVITGVKEAENELKLRQEMENKGFYVFAITKKIGGWSKKVKLYEVLLFIQELSVLLKAGLTMVHSLGILKERAENASFQYIISDIKREVEGGMALSDALNAYPHIFSSMFVSAIKVGETSGNLVSILERQSAYLKKIMSVRRTVIAALIYPIILLTISISVVIVLLAFVVPTFSKLYEDMHKALPPATVFLLSVSHFVKSNFLLLTIIIFSAFYALVLWYRTEKGRITADSLKLKIPLIGNILAKYSLSQLTKMLATVLRGGIPLITSLKVAGETLENKYLSACIKEIIPKVEGGMSLAESMKDITIVPNMTIEMIAVGEATGSLEEMLENISNFYDEEIDMYVASFTALIEPLMILFMGLLVGGIVITMYLPIFQMASGF
ncbi:MAG: type II secretion system F family protein [bacterium]|nr:type II secretion system F family protein [bacterium]